MLSRAPRLAIFALLAAFGCSSTDTSSSGDSSAASPSIEIRSPAEGSCVEVPLDHTAGVPLELIVKGFPLRAQGDCEQTDPCGHVALYVNRDPEKAEGDGEPNNAGATQVIDALSTPDKPFKGKVKMTVKLVKDSGEEAKDSNGQPYSAQVTLNAQTSCGGAGGSGGTTTTGSGSGGTMTTGGSGGTGGTMTTGGSGGTMTTGSGGSGGSGGSMTTGSGGSMTTGSGGSGGVPSGSGGSGGTMTTGSGGSGGAMSSGGSGGMSSGSSSGSGT